MTRRPRGTLRIGVALLMPVALAACAQSSDAGAGTKPVETPAAAPRQPSATPPAAAATPDPVPAAPAAAAANAATDDDAFAQLARLTQAQLATASPQAAALLRTSFEDGCANNAALPFDLVCEHYAADASAADADPSPWPDLMLGIEAGRIASAVLFDPAQRLPEDWHCAAVSGPENVRACFATGVAPADRKAWLERWTRFFATAD